MSGEGADRRMGVAGLVTCGAMTCPCCASKIGNHRAQEVTDTLREHRETVYHPEFPQLSGGCVMITLTLQHHAGQALAFLLAVLRHAWGRVTSGVAYQAELRDFGIVGWISSLEINWSREHGFHPHLHVLILTSTPISYEIGRALGERWFLRWARACGRRGVQSLMDSGGLNVRSCDLSDLSTGALGDYISKVGREAAAGHAKEGRGDSFSTFGRLREVIDTYEVRAFAAGEELERAIVRRKFPTWSDGAQELRKRAGHRREVSNEEIAATNLGTADLITIDPEDWPRLRVMLEVLFGVGERDGLPWGSRSQHLYPLRAARSALKIGLVAR